MYVGDAGDKGQGLFARRSFEFGEVVVEMVCPTYVRKQETKPCGLTEWWATLRETHKMEDDAAIWVGEFDQSFQNTLIDLWGNIIRSTCLGVRQSLERTS